MSKKEKKGHDLAEEAQAVTALIPKLEALVKAHREMAAGYQKYRKNGGEAIPAIEKHLGIKEKNSVPVVRDKESEATAEAEAPPETAGPKKSKKKKSKV